MPEAKLRAVREASAHAYPSGEMPEILAQIERGYVGPTAPASKPRTS
jgi:hypothetical protein